MKWKFKGTRVTVGRVTHTPVKGTSKYYKIVSMGRSEMVSVR